MSKIQNHPDNMLDMNSLQKGASLETSEALHTWERCIVVDVHPANYSVDVYTERGTFHSNLAWPMHSASPSSPACEIDVPRRGQRYAVHYNLGIPTLVDDTSEGLPNAPAGQETRIFNTLENFGGEDGLYVGRGGAQFKGRKPTDVMPGDWLRVGSEGNILGVLEGGINVFKASELCQIIASKSGDLLRLLGRNVDIFTSFGELSFKNDSGNTSMSLKGGSHLSTETHPGQSNYTIHCDLGETGDLVNFRITDPRGNTLAGINYLPNGDVTKLSNSETNNIKNNQTTNVGREVALTVGGSETRSIAGTSTETINGSKQSDVFGSVISHAGQDQTVFAQRDVNLTAGRGMNIIASGDLLAIPGDAAIKTTVANGSWLIDIGNPVSGDLQKALSGFGLSTFLGDVDLSSIAGKLKLRSLIPDSVLLGGQLPIYHAVLFEQLLLWMQELSTRIDSHFHSTGTGPSTPPTIPIATPTTASFNLARSLYVTLGG